MPTTIAKLVGVWIACILLAPPVVAANEELEDLAARLQFAFYAGDTRALQRDLRALQQLAVAESLLAMRQYHASYGHFKLAELLREQDRSNARKSASQCSEIAGDTAGIEAKRGTSAQERKRVEQLQAEFWALQAACSALEAELSLRPGSTSVSLASFRSDKAGAKALAIAPDNPRVKLLAATQEVRRAESADERRTASDKLQAVVAAFDTAPPAADGMPDWGQAEALAWLGEAQLHRGDKMAARNSLERALVLAPDYARARTLLKQSSGK